MCGYTFDNVILELRLLIFSITLLNESGAIL